MYSSRFLLLKNKLIEINFIFNLNKFSKCLAGPPPSIIDNSNMGQRPDSLLGTAPPPFGQRLPSMMSGQPLTSNVNNNAGSGSNSYSNNSGNASGGQHHDDMDIDMDDADPQQQRDKNNQLSLSDQLLAAIGGSGNRFIRF